MSVSRILCGVTISVELWDRSDDAEARLNIEKGLLAKALETYEKMQALSLNAQAVELGGGKFNDQAGSGAGRPFFVIRDVVPQSWHVTYNSFRRADELEITIPLALLPVPIEAIRIISCVATIENVSAQAWSDAMEAGLAVAPASAAASLTEDNDFAGVCREIEHTGGAGDVPMCVLKFSDHTLSLSKKVPAGKEFPEGIPIEEACAQFLLGSPAEGLTCRWVDPNNGSPDARPHRPKLQKKKKKGTGKPTHGKQSYLDVIVQECGHLGIVPRVNVGFLDLAFAGTMYEGRATGAKAEILIGSTVEDWSAAHVLVGPSLDGVAVTSYNIDTGELYMCRWPPAPEKKKADTVDAGKPPLVQPLAANIGLPGYTELDESIVMIPVAPVTDPALLPMIAQAIFLERNRQRLKYTLKLHSPTGGGADLLKLRAGDNLTFGIVSSADGGHDLLPPAVRILSGEYGEASIAALLVQGGTNPGTAKRAAAAIARVPLGSLWRVDELSISGGAATDPTLELKIVNFTVIVSDLQAKFEGRNPDDVIRDFPDTSTLMALSTAALDALFAKARKDVADSDAPAAQKAKARAALDYEQKKVKAGR